MLPTKTQRTSPAVPERPHPAIPEPTAPPNRPPPTDPAALVATLFDADNPNVLPTIRPTDDQIDFQTAQLATHALSPKQFGRWLQLAREEMDLSRTELADITGTTADYWIDNYEEHGVEDPPTRETLCNALTQRSRALREAAQ